MNPPLPGRVKDSDDEQTAAATDASSGMWQCPHCGDTFDLEDNSGRCDCRYD